MSALPSAPPGVVAVVLGYVGSVCLAAACGGDSTGSSAPVATVTVSPNPATVAVDSTLQLTATLRDAAGGTLSGRTVDWSSDDAAIAAVNADGAVTGAGAGSATVTATSEGKSGTTTVTVTATPIQPKPYAVVVGPGYASVPGTDQFLGWDEEGRKMVDRAAAG